MTRKVADLMMDDPVALVDTMTAAFAAEWMRDFGIGDVMVVDGAGLLYGIVTDRDIVVRAVAIGKDPAEVQLRDICSRRLTSIEPSASVDDAMGLMRDNALRRLPVVEGRQPVGVISLGDIAIEQDDRSVLASISAARPSA